MRVTLIHNPDAGDAAHGRGWICALVREAGHELRYVSSKSERWREALDWPCDLLAVAGGDGTVARVSRAAAGGSLPLAVLPLGTANNISTTLGLTGSATEDLVAGWPRGRRKAFDLGEARGPWGTRRFVEGVGAGLVTSTISRLDASGNAPLEGLSDPDERLAAVAAILRRNLERTGPSRFELALDGRDRSGEYLVVEAMNIRHVGPNLHLAPEADPGDGLLDVVLLAEADRAEFRAHLTGQLYGTERPALLQVHRGRHLEMAWSGFEVHIDDELWPQEDARPAVSTDRRIEITVERQALTFLVPPEE